MMNEMMCGIIPHLLIFGYFLKSMSEASKLDTPAMRLRSATVRLGPAQNFCPSRNVLRSCRASSILASFSLSAGAPPNTCGYWKRRVSAGYVSCRFSDPESSKRIGQYYFCHSVYQNYFCNSVCSTVHKTQQRVQKHGSN